MICWSCQADNPSGAKFCFNCGTSIVADPATEAPCRQCAAPLPLDARFCGNCGTPDPLAAPGPAPGLAPGPSPAAALANDEEDEEEATVSRPQLEQAPVLTRQPNLGSGLRAGLGSEPESREHLRTEPSKVASARTLAERLGRGPVESLGVYSKQGPSLRKSVPPPPTTPRKGAIKSDTQQRLPRSGLPPRSVPAPPAPAGRPAPARPAPARPAPARPAPARPAPAPGGPLPKVRPAAPGEAAPPRGARPGSARPAAAGRPPLTSPAKPPQAGARPSEAAALLAAPQGWPDITDDLAEVRFSALQGVDDGVVAEFEALRRQHPGHPDVQTLAVELGLEAATPDEGAALPAGIPSSAGAPGRRPAASTTHAVDGPPPLGRFPTAETPTTDPASVRRAGAPRPSPYETSDELLDVDALEFDDLDDLDDPGPEESMTDLTLVDRMDIPLDLSEDFDSEEPDFVDRTMNGPGQASPYGPPPGPLEARPAGSSPSQAERFDDRRSSTLAPGTDRYDDDERSTTLPPGGYVIERDEPTLAGVSFNLDESSTLAGLAYDHDDPPTLGGGMTFDLEEPTLSDIDASALPSFVAEDPTPLPPGERRSGTMVPLLRDEAALPAPYTGPGGEPPPESGMTAPDRDSDLAAASGTFSVADLGLDDMPDLSAGPPPEPIDFDDRTTDEGTVVARAPVPPAPFGQAAAPLPVLPVLLVMLGPRGEAVAELRIEPGTYLDVGREAGRPWAEDRRMEPLHARLFPGHGGIVVDDFGQPNGVYSQIFDTIAVDDGDEFKVGQARLALQRFFGPGGSWGQLTLVRHDSSALETILLIRDEIILGREEGDVIFPSDTFVSGDHCRFIREGNAVYLEDLGSSNGTYVRVRAGQCVAFGGLLLIGHTQFEVHPA